MGTSSNYDYRTTPSVARRSARDYNVDVGRVYEEQLAVGIPPPVGRNISSNSPTPLIAMIDQTGSMRDWPVTMFEKCGLLDGEVKLYLPDREICPIAIGDAYTDKHSLQVGEFGKDREVEKWFQKIYREGGGGGQGMETYELAAYYLVEHCDIPNAVKPLLIIAGDEGFYPTVNRDHVRKYIGDRISENLDSMEVMKKLREKFDTYILRVDSTLHYYNPGLEGRIQKQWEEALGPEKVLKLTDPGRIVDCTIGIVSSVTQQTDLYMERTTARQTPEQVDKIVKTLHPLLAQAGGQQTEEVKSEEGEG